MGADYAGYQPEVGSESVVEAVDHVAHKTARFGPVPGFASTFCQRPQDILASFRFSIKDRRKRLSQS